jgi:transcriptional regulator with XRE-family HTH domain
VRDYSTIGKNIASLRTAAGYSESELAKLALTSEQNVLLLEGGSPIPTHCLYKLADAVDSTVEKLSEEPRIVTISRKKTR